jgi:hypothetical protein
VHPWSRTTLVMLFGIWLTLSIRAHTGIASDADSNSTQRQDDLVPLISPRPLPPKTSKAEVNGESGKQQKNTLKHVPVPNDAVVLARLDIELVPTFDRPFQRYIWRNKVAVPGTSGEDDFKTVSIALNMVGRGVVIHRPVPVGNLYPPQLLRIDIRRYAPRESDLVDWLKLWEEFRFDPLFNILVTRDAVNFLSETYPEAHAVKDKDCDIFRFSPRHIDTKTLAELQLIMSTEAPIVSADYFCWRSLTTIKDSGVYAKVWGGLYYELRGIRKAEPKTATSDSNSYDTDKEIHKRKITDLDVFLEDLGIGNIKAGLTSDVLFDKLRSDRRIALFRSKVTGKPRRVDWFHGPDSRDSAGAVSITHDLRDRDVDIGTHPIMNLLHLKEAAFEVIAESGNGTHKYAIFDANKALLNEAAGDVVADHTIPAPFSKRLQSALSCLACHEAEGSDGWQSLKNDVPKLLSNRLDVFGDLSQKDRLISDTIERLAGLYQGDFNKAIRRARDDYAETILKCSGPWKESHDQTDVVKVGIGRLVKNTRDYWFAEVTPKTALEDLGVTILDKDMNPVKSEEEYIRTLSLLLPPDPDARTDAFFPEDPRIGALKQGLSIPRADWGLVYGFAASRSQKTLTILMNNPKGIRGK